jgi:hypothetical protein
MTMGWLDRILDLIAASAIGHFAAGVALSLGDRLTTRPRPTSRVARLTRRHDALKILAYLRDLEAGTVAAPGPEPAAAPDPSEMREACEYLRRHVLAGELRLGTDVTAAIDPADGVPRGPYGPDRDPAGPQADGEEDLLDRWRERAGDRWQRLRTWLRHEKLNPLGAMAKLRVAYVLVIVADLLEGLGQLVWGRGHFLGALGHSIYQGAALWLGLVIGGFFCRRREHRAPRKLRKAVERLERELEEDPRAMTLLERIGRGELPVAVERQATRWDHGA